MACIVFIELKTQSRNFISIRGKEAEIQYTSWMFLFWFIFVEVSDILTLSVFFSGYIYPRERGIISSLREYLIIRNVVPTCSTKFEKSGWIRNGKKSWLQFSVIYVLISLPFIGHCVWWFICTPDVYFLTLCDWWAYIYRYIENIIW